MRDKTELQKWNDDIRSYCNNLKLKMKNITPNKFIKCRSVFMNPTREIDNLNDVVRFMNLTDSNIVLIKSNLTTDVDIPKIKNKDIKLSEKDAVNLAYNLYKSKLQKIASGKYFDDIKSLYKESLRYKKNEEDYKNIIKNINMIIKLKKSNGDALLSYISNVYRRLPEILRNDRKDTPINESVLFDINLFLEKTESIEEVKERYLKKYKYDKSKHRIEVRGKKYTIKFSSKIGSTSSVIGHGDTEGVIILGKEFFMLKTDSRRDAVLNHEIGHLRMHSTNVKDEKMDKRFASKEVSDDTKKILNDLKQKNSSIIKDYKNDLKEYNNLANKNSNTKSSKQRKDGLKNAKKYSDKYKDSGFDEFEVEADRYAANRTSEKDVKKSLKEINKYIGKDIKKNDKDAYKDWKSRSSRNKKGREKALKDRDLRNNSLYKPVKTESVSDIFNEYYDIYGSIENAIKNIEIDFMESNISCELYCDLKDFYENI